MKTERNFKRMTKAALIAIAASIMLTGCTGKKKVTEEQGASKANEPYSMKFIRRNDSTAFTKATVEAIKKKAKDKFNIDLTIEDIEKNIYNEKINLYFASKNLPDLLYMSEVDKITEAIKNGVFINVDDVVNKDPEWSKIDKKYFSKLKYDGHYYSLPDMKNLPETIYYRVDWAKKLNLKNPTNPEELYNMLSAFAKKDPDGNGKQDTYGFSIQGDYYFSDAYWKMFLPGTIRDGSIYLDSKDNTFKSSIISLPEDMKAALTWFRKAYAEGVLDKEFVISKSKELEDKFIQGKTGAWIKGVQFIVPRYEKMKAKFPEVEITTIPTFKGKYNAIYTVPGSKQDAYFITAESKDSDRVKKFLGYFCGAEGVKDKTMGQENVDYAIENGKVKWINADGQKEYNPGQLLSSIFEIKLPEAIPVLEKNVENAKGYELSADYSAYINSSETYTTKITDVNKIVVEHITKVIMGETPVDQIDKLISECKKAGLDKMLEEINKAYKK